LLLLDPFSLAGIYLYWWCIITLSSVSGWTILLYQCPVSHFSSLIVIRSSSFPITAQSIGDSAVPDLVTAATTGEKEKGRVEIDGRPKRLTKEMSFEIKDLLMI
jgi:hypothetical protein